MPKSLVTGASSGIGAAVARKLAARGHEVWLAARRRDRLDAEVQALRATGANAHAVELDVANAAETAQRVEALDEEVGGFDLVLANAGVGGRGKMVSLTTWQDVQTVFATNVTGALATLLPVVPRMIARGHGHIAAVSSVAGTIALPAAADYGASKAALTFFLESAQGELPAKGVDVTIIHPGFVKTDLTAKNKFPMPFLVDVEDAARIIDDGLARRAGLVAFPLGMVGLIALGNAIPRALKNRVVTRSVPK